MPKKITEEIQQSFDKGLEIIIYAFNEQKKEYSKTIYEQEIEIKKLKEENTAYKNKLSLLHKKLYTISKTFCDINIDTEEAKIQSELNQNISFQNELNTINNIYPEKNKKESFNQNSYIYKNHKFSSFQEEPKTSQIHKKKNSSNHHYNLKYLLNRNNNKEYKRLIGNLNYLKKKKTKNDNNVENELQNDIEEKRETDINNYEKSKTDRDYVHKKIFSEKFLNIKVNENDAEIPELLNNNNFSFNHTNSNNDDLNINNEFDIKIENDSDIELKNKKYEDNMNSKISSDDESKVQSNPNISKKLNIFLEKCKVKLNALDYEKIINILKYYENHPKYDIIQKIKMIINNNNKLCKLFDDILECS